MFNVSRNLWISRSLIGLVLFLNVQCAVVFLIIPDAYAPGFELQGAVGVGIIRAMGILFLMWNVPYSVAFVDPVRWRISHYEAVTMQAMAFFGEGILLLFFEPGHLMLRATIGRFLLFDGVGLVALLLSLWFARQAQKKSLIKGNVV